MLKNGKTVSVVVPIYNEELTLKRMVEMLVSCETVDEVICVNDGSTDGSEEILESFDGKITKISYTINKGKGFAMAEGIKEAKSDLIFFLDADFTNFQCKHVNKMLAPMEKHDDIAVVIATFDIFGPGIIWKEVVGQRVYYKEHLTPLLDEMAESRWGVEILLNKRLSDKKVERVHIGREVGHVVKPMKHSPLVAIQEYLVEGIEIGQQLLKFETVSKEDQAVLKSLKDVRDFIEFDTWVEKIKNKRIRETLHEYVERYLKVR